MRWIKYGNELGGMRGTGGGEKADFSALFDAACRRGGNWGKVSGGEVGVGGGERGRQGGGKGGGGGARSVGERIEHFYWKTRGRLDKKRRTQSLYQQGSSKGEKRVLRKKKSGGPLRGV